MNEKKRVMFVSVSPQLFWSGTGNLSAHIVPKIAEHYQVVVVGWGCGYSSEQKYEIVPNSEQWWLQVEKVKPDLIFLSHDIFRFPEIVSVKKQFPNISVVGYFPIDCDCISRAWFGILDACDAVIVHSKFAKRAIEKRYSHPLIFVVPLGVDKQFFYSGSKELIKPIELKEKMVFLYVGANQNKKLVGNVLDGFDWFSRDKSDVMLLIVTHSKVMQFGEQLVKTEYDFNDMFVWRKVLDKIRVCDDAALEENAIADMFKISDVNILLSMGEGFGLPVLEGIAASCVPILSGYSAMIETPAFYFPVPITFLKVAWNANRAVVDYTEFARILEAAYRTWKNHPEKWNEIKSLNYSRSLEFTWEKCTNRILDVLDIVLSGKSFGAINLSIRRLT